MNTSKKVTPCQTLARQNIHRTPPPINRPSLRLINFRDVLVDKGCYICDAVILVGLMEYGSVNYVWCWISTSYYLFLNFSYLQVAFRTFIAIIKLVNFRCICNVSFAPRRFVSSIFKIVVFACWCHVPWLPSLVHSNSVKYVSSSLLNFGDTA